MAGLATSASISSFVTWSTCSGHRSLNGIRTLVTYTGARKSNLPNCRLLDRTATINGPSAVPRVRLSIHVFPSLPPLTLKPVYWQLATLSCFNARVGAQRSVSSFGYKKGRNSSRNKENIFFRASGIIVPKFITRGCVLTPQTARSQISSRYKS